MNSMPPKEGSQQSPALLLVAARSELKFTRLDASSVSAQERWTVYDPIARRSYRVGRVELEILRRCHSFRPLGKVLADLHRDIRGWDAGEVQLVATGLLANGLIRSRELASVARPNHPEVLDGASSVSGIPNLGRLLSSSIVWQVRGVNPDAALKKLSPFFDWLFARSSVVAWLVFALFTWLAVGLDFHRLTVSASTIHWFGTAEFTGVLLAVFLLTRALHEFGHAIVCRRMGIRCPDIGFLVILGAPCMYCDVTECSKLPSRFQRAAVAAAGMYTELVLASWCAWVWLLTDAGPINSLALQVMTVCSVSTLLINANPLMRFDGYYILADWLDEVNLRSKADRLLGENLAVLLSGARERAVKDMGLQPKQPQRIRSRQAFLQSFSAAGWAYRSMLTIAIATAVYMIFQNWKLEWMGRALFATIIFSWWGVPVATFFSKTMRRSWRVGKPLRPVVASGLLVALCLYFPIPMRHFAVGHTAPAQAVTLYTEGESVLTGIGVADGQVVDADDLLFRMQSPTLLQRYVSRMADWKNAEERLVAARHQRNMHMDDIDLGPMQQQVVMLGQLVNRTADELKRLEVQAPIAGVFVANQSMEHGVLGLSVSIPPASQWSDPIELGRTVPAGTPLGQVCSQATIAVVPLSDSQLRYVAAGTIARVRIPGAPPVVVDSRVTKLVDLEKHAERQNMRVGELADRQAIVSGASRYAALIPVPVDQTVSSAAIRAIEVQVVFHSPSRSLFDLATQWSHRNLRLLAN